MKRILLLLLLIACTSSSEHLVRLNIICDPPSLDPGIARDLTSKTVLMMLFEGLCRIDTSNQPALALATSITISEDGKHYTFRLRKSRWNNGDLLTADDFVRAYRRALDPNFPAEQADLLFVIKNARAAKFGEAPLSSIGVHAPNPFTLEIELEHVAPYFLQLTATPTYYPVHRSGPQITNGPFYLDEWVPMSHLILRRSPTFWDPVDLPGIHMIMIEDVNTELQMFEQGELDWAGGPTSVIPFDAVPRLREQGLLKKRAARSIYWYEFNQAVPPFDDVEVRRAFSHAIDREVLARHITKNSHTPLSHRGPTQELPIDPVVLSINVADDHLQIAQAIQQQWEEKLAVSISIRSADWKVHLERLSQGDYQIARYSYEANFDDPVDYLNQFRYGRLQQPKEYLDLLDILDQTVDPDARARLVDAAYAYLEEEAPIAPIFNVQYNYICTPHLDGVVFSNTGFIDFRYASWRTTHSPIDTHLDR